MKKNIFILMIMIVIVILLLNCPYFQLMSYKEWAEKNGSSGGGGSDSTTGTETAVWSGIKQLGPSGAEARGNGAAVDTSGNVFVAGYTQGGLNGNTQTGTMDYFVAKYDSSGTLSWLRQLGASGAAARGNGVAVDTSGNVFVGGYTAGGLNGNTQTGSYDYFIAKYNPSGTISWLRQLGASGVSAYGNGAAVDTNGNVFIGGYTNGGLNGNTQTGTMDYFVAKYNSSGTLSWLRQLGASGVSAYGNGAAVDTSGNVFVGGYTNGGLNGNTQTGSYDYFVAKYDSSGTLSWLRQLGASGTNTFGRGLAVDTSGNVFVTGNTNGGLNGNTLTGAMDYFVAKYDPSGTLSWLRQLGPSGTNAFGNGVAVNTSGNVFVAGYTSGGLNGNTLTGAIDYFVAKYNTSGTLSWLRQLGSSPSSTGAYGNGAAVDTSGNVFVAGYTSGGLNGNTLTGAMDYFVAKYDPSGTLQ